MTRSRRIFLLGWLLALIVTLGYFLLYWNRFAGIRSGLGGFGGGHALLHGQMPYRDYFAAATPLSILTAGAALRLFGDTIAVTRGLGVFERLVIASLLYVWLQRFFRARDVVIATVVTMVLSAGDISDPISSYNHEAIMWAIAGGFAASFALESKSGSRSFAMAAMASGFFAALSFATKQTIGLGATVFIPAVVSMCLPRLTGTRAAGAFLIRFLAAWTAAAALILWWLGSLGILREFVIDVFLKGPAAKGTNAVDFLRRDFLVTRSLWLAAALGLILLAVLWKTFRESSALGEKHGHQQGRADSLPSILQAAMFCGAGIGGGAIASYLGFAGMLPLAKPAIYLTVFATLALITGYLRNWLSGTISPRQAQLFLLSVLSFVMALMVSLSYPIFEAMLLPGLGLLTAMALNGLAGRRAGFAYAVCGLLLFTQTCVRLNAPFGFAGFVEPAVSGATASSKLPELRGLRLPEAIADFIDETAQIIADRSGADDTIFTYPEMGIFYAVTNRRYPTLSGSHNIDVVNDSFAREEAGRVLAGRPAVLIYSPDSEDFLRVEELLWRNARPSGQRDILAAVETLASQYELVRTFRLPPAGRLVRVYARPLSAGTSSSTRE